MKKILNILSILLILMTLVLIASCEDKPKTPEKTPQEETQEKIDNAVIEEEAEKPSVNALDGVYEIGRNNFNIADAEDGYLLINGNKAECIIFSYTRGSDPVTNKRTCTNENITTLSYTITIDKGTRTITAVDESGTTFSPLSGTYTLAMEHDNIKLKISQGDTTNSYNTFKKLTNDGTTLSLATKENTLGSWGRTQEDTDSDGNKTESKYIYTFKEDKTYMLTNYDYSGQKITETSISNMTYYKDGIFKEVDSDGDESLEFLLVVDGKYLLLDGNLYSKVSGEELTADPDNNPLNGKTYTPPTVTDKAEGLYFDVGSYDVDLLSNGNALLIDRDGNIINGTYTVDGTSGDISINAGDITLNIPNGDRDDKKISDEHISKISEESELNGLWFYYNGSYYDGYNFSNRKMTMYSYEVGRSLISGEAQYTFNDSAINAMGTTIPLYKVGSYLLFNNYELSQKVQ